MNLPGRYILVNFICLTTWDYSKQLALNNILYKVLLNQCLNVYNNKIKSAVGECVTLHTPCHIFKLSWMPISMFYKVRMVLYTYSMSHKYICFWGPSDMAFHLLIQMENMCLSISRSYTLKICNFYKIRSKAVRLYSDHELFAVY